jgi:hypothetical protein
MTGKPPACMALVPPCGLRVQGMITCCKNAIILRSSLINACKLTWNHKSHELDHWSMSLVSAVRVLLDLSNALRVVR